MLPQTVQSPTAYKLGMRRLATGVTVISTEYAGKQFGLLSTSMTSVSAQPAVLLICVNRSASAHAPIEQSGRFCVNVLRRGDEELGKRFSSPENRDSRFQDRRWDKLTTGAPALVGCLVSFDCFVKRALQADSHTVFFGSVAEVRLWGAAIDPLLYWDGSYRDCISS